MSERMPVLRASEETDEEAIMINFKLNTDVNIMIKLCMCLINHTTKKYGAFLTSSMDESEWSASRPSHFTPQTSNPLDKRLGGAHRYVFAVSNI
jgi:hypothetical protein